MACCCKINTKGVFGIIFSNAGFALLLASFLSCYWLTSPLPEDEENSTATVGLVTTTQIATTNGSANTSDDPGAGQDNSGLIRCNPAIMKLTESGEYCSSELNDRTVLCNGITHVWSTVTRCV